MVHFGAMTVMWTTLARTRPKTLWMVTLGCTTDKHTHMFAQIMPINWIDKTYYPWFDSFSTFDITSPEEMETEKKFDEGMLVKLSKITDLMSRLETYDDLGEGDRKRMQSSIAQYCDVYT